ncbi:MAG: hypothetical protein PHF17_10920 [Arcobacteraceae bacterium]|nr:hypothetical protein [Arcobacteraceae bacterium]
MTLFFSNQTIAEGIDSLAWLLLLLLLEWETSQLDMDIVAKSERVLLKLGRIISYIFIVYSIVIYGGESYIIENGILDFYNAIIWFIVVMILEYELFSKKLFSRRKETFLNILKFLLYFSLFVIAILWQMDGEWLDFYDAALWIICFFFIELNIVQYKDYLERKNEVPKW